MTQNWNPRGVAVAITVPIAGYCFGGLHGLGVGCILIALINVFNL